MLTTQIQQYLLTTNLPEGEDMEDIVIDAQEYGLWELIALAADSMQPEDIVQLEHMIEEGKSATDIDTWIVTKIPWYDQYATQALNAVQIYLTTEE